MKISFDMTMEEPLCDTYLINSSKIVFKSTLEVLESLCESSISSSYDQQ